jgi:predicted lipoprotein with Yx(FWY)xxD motif
MTPLSRTLIAVVVAAGTCTLSACGVRDLGTSAEPQTVAVPAMAAPATTAPGRPTAPPVAEPRPTAPTEPVLRAKLTRKHGTVVVDADGMTLYRSDKDSAKPSRSRCTGACTKLWKPALAPGVDLPVAGIDPDVVGTIIRPDGTPQLTIAGWPVYRFAKDARPGDIKGQCKARFFAITPEGGRTM